jgi:hypothetical protein
MYNIGFNVFNSYGTEVTEGDQEEIGLPNDVPMPDGDLIYLTPEDGGPYNIAGDHVGIGLETAPGVTWHKYILATDGGAITYGRIDLENNHHGPYEITVPASAFLILGKAKFLGQWTSIYQTPGLGFYAGAHLKFYWSKD